MPCAVTAFSVNIASLGDAGIEFAIACAVIADWNAHHTLETKQILLPVDEETAPEEYPCDMLVAFFCNAQGNAADRISRCDLQIEQHLQGGKPALIYLSDARDDLAKTQGLRKFALEECRKRFAAAVIESFGDEKELRAKFARQLEATLETHPHFKIPAPGASQLPKEISTVPAPQTPKPLSACAQTILIEACDDFEAYIGRNKIGDTLRIQANGKQLVEQGDPAAAAKWESAFQELLSGAYIAELGGM
jgi:hypothetical protein